MEVSSGTKLAKYSAFSYQSFGSPSEFTDESSANEDTCDTKSKTNPIPLKELVSGSPDILHQKPLKLSEEEEEEEQWCGPESPVHVYSVAIVISVGVTIALILQIYLDASLVIVDGVLTDHERCTVLSEGVLRDGGSSVDAAIAGALCLGVVHQHVSGIGGGGVMLVHDIRRNKTKVLNFDVSAPEKLNWEVLGNASTMKAGLFVGVPGMLMGLHHAHRLYGSLPWEDVVCRAASVARKGFNVSESLAKAISDVEAAELPKRFRDVFLPKGQALRPGSFVQMPGLAEVLEAGVWNFYSGNLSQEIVNEVSVNGGVLSKEDLGNYSAEIQAPLEEQYSDFIVQVPPPPSAGAALIAALNVLEGFHLKEKDIKKTKMLLWINQTLAATMTMASGLGGHGNNSTTDLLSSMLNKSHAEVLRHRLNLSQTSQSPHNFSIHSLPAELLTAQVVVMGPDNLMVSMASSLNKPFGSKIMTESGILLNSLVLDFFRPNTTTAEPQIKQKNGTESKIRPLTFLMPAMVIPTWDKCGTYMALSSSGGQNHLSKITQMLVNVLFLHQSKNDSLSLKRSHNQLQPKRIP